MEWDGTMPVAAAAARETLAVTVESDLDHNQLARRWLAGLVTTHCHWCVSSDMGTGVGRGGRRRTGQASTACSRDALLRRT